MNEMRYLHDRTLTAQQLSEQYNPDGNGEHPVWTRAEWRLAVAQERTLGGYWFWVQANLFSVDWDELADGDRIDDGPRPGQKWVGRSSLRSLEDTSVGVTQLADSGQTVIFARQNSVCTLPLPQFLTNYRLSTDR